MSDHLTPSLPREFFVPSIPTRVCCYHQISFSDFFSTPAHQGAAPLATGFDGFFKGAFSYHFHNSWYVHPAANEQAHSLTRSTPGGGPSIRPATGLISDHVLWRKNVPPEQLPTPTLIRTIGQTSWMTTRSISTGLRC